MFLLGPKCTVSIWWTDTEGMWAIWQEENNSSVCVVYLGSAPGEETNSWSYQRGRGIICQSWDGGQWYTSVEQSGEDLRLIPTQVFVRYAENKVQEGENQE